MVMEKLKEAQQEILNYSPNGYYVLAYKDAEKNYWRDLLNWLYTRSLCAKECLDIGAAYGTLSLFCKVSNPLVNLTVIDRIKYMSKEIIEQYKIEYCLQDFELEEIPFDKKFDIIILTEVFEHFNFNPVPTMVKIRSLLTEDGSLFLGTPNATLWGHMGNYNSWENMPLPNKETQIKDAHIYQYTLSELEDIFKRTGFVIKNMNNTGSYHLNFELGVKNG
jgi:2-polyprenyl-3-methyl-5-hydroxy-6-metoxy-1,4-benzoquinol methylase